MAFNNVVFPALKLIHGFSKTISNPVGIVQNGTSEYRLKKSAYSRFSWTYPSRTLVDADKLTLLKFYSDCGGSLTSFKFQDPDMPKFVNQPLTWLKVDPANSSNSLYAFNLPAGPGVVGTHPLFAFDPAMTVKIGASAKAWTFKLDPATGLPCISVIGTTASTLSVNGNIYFSARFDSVMSYTMDALNLDNTTAIATMSDISLIEVFEGTLT